MNRGYEPGCVLEKGGMLWIGDEDVLTTGIGGKRMALATHIASAAIDFVVGDHWSPVREKAPDHEDPSPHEIWFI